MGIAERGSRRLRRTFFGSQTHDSPDSLALVGGPFYAARLLLFTGLAI